VRSDGAAARGEQWPDAEREAFMAQIREGYDLQGHPYYASARLWDDGCIDPVQTRDVLGMALAVACSSPIATAPPHRSGDGFESAQFGIFRF